MIPVYYYSCLARHRFKLVSIAGCIVIISIIVSFYIYYSRLPYFQYVHIRQMVWSPAGTRLAVINKDMSYVLIHYNADGMVVKSRVLVPFAPSSVITTPFLGSLEWSPDSKILKGVRAWNYATVSNFSGETRTFEWEADTGNVLRDDVTRIPSMPSSATQIMPRAIPTVATIPVSASSFPVPYCTAIDAASDTNAPLIRDAIGVNYTYPWGRWGSPLSVIHVRSRR